MEDKSVCLGWPATLQLNVWVLTTSLSTLPFPSLPLSFSLFPTLSAGLNFRPQNRKHMLLLRMTIFCLSFVFVKHDADCCSRIEDNVDRWFDSPAVFQKTLCPNGWVLNAKDRKWNKQKCNPIVCLLCNLLILFVKMWIYFQYGYVISIFDTIQISMYLFIVIRRPKMASCSM